MKCRRARSLAALFIVVGGIAGHAVAVPVRYQFEAVTANNVADVATGEAQLYMLVESVAGNKVSFTFHNDGPLASSICDIYWDDMFDSKKGIGTSILSDSGVVITDSGAGVSFSMGASPGNLPGGNSIGFKASISADSNNPTQPMGVNPGEWVKFVFSIKSPYTYSNVLGELNPYVNTGLRVGIHVQGFTGGGSESFIAVPAPAAVWGGASLLTALGGLRILRRRQ